MSRSTVHRGAGWISELSCPMEYSEEVGNFGRHPVYLNTWQYVLNREHMEGPQMSSD